jgi:hypothetical protein
MSDCWQVRLNEPCRTRTCGPLVKRSWLLFTGLLALTSYIYYPSRYKDLRGLVERAVLMVCGWYRSFSNHCATYLLR